MFYQSCQSEEEEVIWGRKWMETVSQQQQVQKQRHVHWGSKNGINVTRAGLTAQRCRGDRESDMGKWSSWKLKHPWQELPKWGGGDLGWRAGEWESGDEHEGRDTQKVNTGNSAALLVPKWIPYKVSRLTALQSYFFELVGLVLPKQGF